MAHNLSQTLKSLSDNACSGKMVLIKKERKRTTCEPVGPWDQQGRWGGHACRWVCVEQHMGSENHIFMSWTVHRQLRLSTAALWAEPQHCARGIRGTIWRTNMWSEPSRGCAIMCAWPSVSWPGVWPRPEQRCPRWLGPCSSLPGHDSSAATGGGSPAARGRRREFNRCCLDERILTLNESIYEGGCWLSKLTTTESCNS